MSKSVVFQWAVIVGFGLASGVSVFKLVIDMCNWVGHMVVALIL